MKKIACAKSWIKSGIAAVAAVALACSMAFTAAPSSEAYAASNEQTITVSVEGISDAGRTISFSELNSNGLINTTDTKGYQYLKPSGDWYVVGARNYVTIDALFAYAGVSQYWTEGATLSFVCSDGTYTKYYPTYEECTRDNYFYTNIQATDDEPVDTNYSEPTPTVIAFDYLQEAIPAGMTAQGVIYDSLENDESSFEWTEGVRFCVGCDDSTINSTGDDNMGKRMPTDVVEIIIVPASATS